MDSRVWKSWETGFCIGYCLLNLRKWGYVWTVCKTKPKKWRHMEIQLEGYSWGLHVLQLTSTWHVRDESHWPMSIVCLEQHLLPLENVVQIQELKTVRFSLLSFSNLLWTWPTRQMFFAWTAKPLQGKGMCQPFVWLWTICHLMKYLCKQDEEKTCQYWST